MISEQLFRIWIGAQFNNTKYNSGPLSREDARNLAELMRKHFPENIITVRDAWTNKEIIE